MDHGNQLKLVAWLVATVAWECCLLLVMTGGLEENEPPTFPRNFSQRTTDVNRRLGVHVFSCLPLLAAIANPLYYTKTITDLARKKENQV